MILTGRQIQEARAQGQLRIEPWRDEQLNPNSYNLRLGEDLAVYTERELDMARPNGIEFLKIPPEGLLLQPGRIYAGVAICQIFYHTVSGAYDSYESGKYQRNSGIQPSMLWKDFIKD